MITSPLRRASLILGSLLAVACSTARPAARPRSAPVAARPAPLPLAAELYAADEALRDALSGPWEYLGTGRWPGINRMQACAYRNDRVLIVNVYCTLSESPAFRVDVYSPSRGRVRIYAESRGPISNESRRDYFTFTAESEPPPSALAQLPALALAMSFQQLHDYDAQRHRAYLPACYAGTEHSHDRVGCLSPLEARVGAWAARNRVFLEQANDDWYRLVRNARALATQHGREPE
jgi:hypothetical protein